MTTTDEDEKSAICPTEFWTLRRECNSSASYRQLHHVCGVRRRKRSVADA
jgi:hypothetical protein